MLLNQGAHTGRVGLQPKRGDEIKVCLPWPPVFGRVCPNDERALIERLCRHSGQVTGGYSPGEADRRCTAVRMPRSRWISFSSSCAR